MLELGRVDRPEGRRLPREGGVGAQEDPVRAHPLGHHPLSSIIDHRYSGRMVTGASSRQRPLTRTVLREQLKEQLLARILDGEYEPGERLVETQIAKEFGTSQAPVREALRDLEALRLVQT